MRSQRYTGIRKRVGEGGKKIFLPSSRKKSKESEDGQAQAVKFAKNEKKTKNSSRTLGSTKRGNDTFSTAHA